LLHSEGFVSSNFQGEKKVAWQQTSLGNNQVPNTYQDEFSHVMGQPSDGAEWASHAAGTPLLGGDNVPFRSGAQEFEQAPRQPPTSWEPFYLRRSVFYAFMALFGVMILALEAIFAVSLHKHGLATSYSHLHYLWTYGPTAVIILVAVIWARLDYEAKITAPWLRPRTASGTREMLLLDYISMFPLSVPFKALRNRDYLVAASATISLLFSVLVVLSTGLITLSLTQVKNDSTPIVLRTAFVDDPTRLSHPGLLPLYAMKGISDYNLTYTDGSSDQFAFQSFSSLSPAPELYAAVDGISTGLDCQQASIESVEIRPQISDQAQPKVVINTTSNGCDISYSFQAPLINEDGPRPSDVGESGTMHLARLMPGNCGTSTDLESKRVAFWLAKLQFTVAAKDTVGGQGSRPSTTVHWNGTILESAVLFCTPTYSLTSVDVAKNSVGLQNVSRHTKAPSRTLSRVHPWDIMEGHFASYGFNPINSNADSSADLNLFTSQEVNISTTTIVVDPYSSLILGNSTDLFQQSASLFNHTILETLATKYYRSFSAFLLQQNLMEPVNEPSTARALMIEDRLVVKAMACQWMAGMLLLSILILLVVQPRIPERGFFRFEPGSIIGTAALAGMTVATSFPRNLGGATKATLQRQVYERSNGQLATDYRLDSANFMGRQMGGNETESISTMHRVKMIHPSTLQPLSRVAVYVLVAGFIATLESTLQKSIRDQGLGDVEDDTYLHYLWTTLPAIILSLTGIFFSSVDFQTRLLAPYRTLMKSSSFKPSLHLDLLRPLLPRVLQSEIQTRNLAALATTLAALFSATFTIVSSSLFLAISVPAATSVQLRTVGTFAKNASEFDPDYAPVPNIVSTLVLEANLSYPAWTYGDLVFPKFAIEDVAAVNYSQPSNTSAIVFDVVVPALRPRLTCHAYPISSITTGFEYNHTLYLSGLPDPVNSDALLINVTGEVCAENSFGAVYSSTATFWTNQTSPTEAFFAAADGVDLADIRSCSRFFYIWGHFSMLSDPPAVTVSAMSCNISLESVDVATSFTGSDLQINMAKLPQPDESTVRSIPDIHESETFNPYAGSFYDTLESLPLKKGTIFDHFFSQLVTSRNAIPISALGDAGQAKAVEEAIAYQHGVIRAQFHNTYSRMDLDAAEGVVYPPLSTASGSDDTGVYEAKVTDPYGRRRLMQDAVSTRLLEALLAVALLLALLGWFLDRQTAVLPRSPSSAASVLALLAGGDILDHMYAKGGKWTGSSLGDVRRAFGEDCQFWMGWGPPGVGEELKQRFGIWVIRREAAYMGAVEENETGHNDGGGPYGDLGKPGLTEYQGAGAAHDTFQHGDITMTEITVTPWACGSRW
jgi:hypothetical protein